MFCPWVAKFSVTWGNFSIGLFFHCFNFFLVLIRSLSQSVSACAQCPGLYFFTPLDSESQLHFTVKKYTFTVMHFYYLLLFFVLILFWSQGVTACAQCSQISIVFHPWIEKIGFTLRYLYIVDFFLLSQVRKSGCNCICLVCHDSSSMSFTYV